MCIYIQLILSLIYSVRVLNKKIECIMIFFYKIKFPHNPKLIEVNLFLQRWHESNRYIPHSWQDLQFFLQTCMRTEQETIVRAELSLPRNTIEIFLFANHFPWRGNTLHPLQEVSTSYSYMQGKYLYQNYLKQDAEWLHRIVVWIQHRITWIKVPIVKIFKSVLVSLIKY